MATSVHGKYCTAKATGAFLSLMQQTEQMARRHDVWHYAAVESDSTKRDFIRSGVPAGLGKSGKTFQLIREQHLEQLPMHSSCCAFALSAAVGIFGRVWMKQKAARPVRRMCSPGFQPQQQLLRCWPLLVRSQRAAISITPAIAARRLENRSATRSVSQRRWILRNADGSG